MKFTFEVITGLEQQANCLIQCLRNLVPLIPENTQCVVYNVRPSGSQVIFHGLGEDGHKIVKNIIHKFKAKAKKTPYSAGFIYTIQIGSVKINFVDILPPSCRLETKEVPLPEYEKLSYQEALEKGTKTITEVVCYGRNRDKSTIDVVQQLEGDPSLI